MRSTRDGEAWAAAEPRWSLKPHQQIAIIWFAALTALAVVMALTYVRLNAVDSSYRKVARRAVPKLRLVQLLSAGYDKATITAQRQTCMQGSGVRGSRLSA